MLYEVITLDYPVMYHPEDEAFYLTHNFEGVTDKNGCLFIQACCYPFIDGGNLIIHGHNMKSGKMFGSLKNYMDEPYFHEHRNNFV